MMAPAVVMAASAASDAFTTSSSGANHTPGKKKHRTEIQRGRVDKRGHRTVKHA